MIDVHTALKRVPHFDTFCSVASLTALVGELEADRRFSVDEIGTSVNGAPIHHVRFGRGGAKALFVGGPHAMEPIGGLTVSSLLTLLRQNERALLEADVEWHVVPCIDPDGAILNEGWSLKPFRFEDYIRNFYLQSTKDMVDTSFPVKYKDLEWTTPSHEASILKALIDRERPDFYYGLHNAWIGGTFWFISRRIDAKYFEQLHQLTTKYGLPVQKRGLWRETSEQFYDGIFEMPDVTRFYDHAALTSSKPGDVIRYGASSRYYLTSLKPSAVTFVTEMGYVRHPDDESEALTGRNLRQFQLQLDASNKFLATVFLEEWDRAKDDVDKSSPFYKAIIGGDAIPLDREQIARGGMPMSWYPTRQILFDAENNREATKADLFNAAMVYGGAFFLRWSHQFVRLLEASPQTARVHAARERVQKAFDDALAEIARHVDFSQFRTVPCDDLARIQLGSGLIAINALLEERTGAPC